MKDNGKKIFLRVMVSKFGLEHHNTKEIFAMGLKKGPDSTEGMGNLNIEVVLKKISLKD